MGIPHYNMNKEFPSEIPGQDPSSGGKSFFTFFKFLPSGRSAIREEDSMQPKSFREDKRQSTLDDQTTLLEGLIFRIMYLTQVVTGAAFLIIVILLMIFFNQ